MRAGETMHHRAKPAMLCRGCRRQWQARLCDLPLLLHPHSLYVAQCGPLRCRALPDRQSSRRPPGTGALPLPLPLPPDQCCSPSSVCAARSRLAPQWTASWGCWRSRASPCQVGTHIRASQGAARLVVAVVMAAGRWGSQITPAGEPGSSAIRSRAGALRGTAGDTFAHSSTRCCRLESVQPLLHLYRLPRRTAVRTGCVPLPLRPAAQRAMAPRARPACSYVQATLTPHPPQPVDAPLAA